MPLLRRAFVLSCVAGGLTAFGHPDALAAPAESAGARSGYPSLSVGTGFDVTDGKYGGDTNTRVIEVPFRVRYATERHVWSVTLPYVEIHSQRTAVITDGAVVVGRTQTPQRVSGMGDVVATYTYKAAAPGSAWYFDYTARIKFGTAETENGLGTGKNDYTLQFLVGRDIGKFTPTVEAGYRFRGRPADFAVKDSAFAAVGTRYYHDRAHYFDIYYDYRQAAAPGAAPQREVSLYYGYRPLPALRLEAYVLKGHSDASPDRGIGMRMSYYF